MSKINLKIYENSVDHKEWSWWTESSMKLQRGWLHLVETRSGKYQLIWTMRRNQETCEIVRPEGVLLSSTELLEKWKSNGFTYTLVGKRTLKKLAGTNKRDSQRQKCYDWEGKYLSKHYKTIDQSEMTAFIKKVALENKVKITKIKYRSGGVCSYARGSTELAFLPCHMNKIVACHEIAHLIVYAKYGTKVAGHGPEWVREYARLLVAYCGFVESTLKISLTNSGIKF